MSIRDDYSERLFYILESSIRVGLCTHEQAALTFSSAGYLSGGKRYLPLAERLKGTKPYPQLSKLRGPPVRRKVVVVMPE